MPKYIDADALLKKVQQESMQAEIHGRDFSTCFLNAGNTPSTEWWWVEDLIENAPAADVEERKYGYDVETKYSSLFQCSQCGAECCDIHELTHDIHFCYHCGARIIKETKDDGGITT